MAGTSGVRIHDLRHSFASHLVSSGVAQVLVCDPRRNAYEAKAALLRETKP